MINIISHGTRRRPRADRTIDCRHLPNPHDIPAFRPRDGRDPRVRDWILGRVESQTLIKREVSRIADGDTISVMCSAGRHRSVAVAEELRDALTDMGMEVTVRHQNLKPRRKSTTERGLGWRHQRQRRRLLAMHVDGTPCWWCGQPMYRTQDLDADHSESRHYAGPHVLADRLMHASCNRSRQQGDRDHERPALKARANPGATAFEW